MTQTARHRYTAKLRRCGVLPSKRAELEARREKERGLYRSGLSIAQVAKLVGLTAGAVLHDLKAIGEPRRPANWPVRRGVSHPGHKLTESQVLAIRESSDPAKAAAERFGVSRSLVHRIRAGLTWRHVGSGKRG